jgi:hypothetical protein
VALSDAAAYVLRHGISSGRFNGLTREVDGRIRYAPDVAPLVSSRGPTSSVTTLSMATSIPKRQRHFSGNERGNSVHAPHTSTGALPSYSAIAA